MSGLRLEQIGKEFGHVVAVKDVDLDLPHGRLVCLLGPSGCGKTTLLRLIAGLERPTTGRVLLDGEDITDMPAHRRGFGMVFQSLALFPHLSVGENIAYGLRIRRVERSSRARRVEELLELVRLPGVADRHVSQLSGGQRQRVAMARALALEPKLFLLDEPLSALDAKLREAMQVELRLLQERLGITTIIVTHDQREAMALADVVVVMKDGETQQVGTPQDIYREPANTFVADFIGTTNLLCGTRTSDDTIQVGAHTLKVGRLRDGLSPGQTASISVRPEEIHIFPGTRAGENCLPGTVTLVRDFGASIEIAVDCDGISLIGVLAPRNRPEVGPGDAVTVEIPANACAALPT